MAIFGRAAQPSASPNGAKTWTEIEQLLRAIRGNSRKAHLTVFNDSECWITVETGMSKVIGRGRDPWAAAHDLAEQSDLVASAIRNAMPSARDVSGQEAGLRQ